MAQGKACPVCLENKRDARLLPCLHSLCRACIDNLEITAGKDVPCPVCRASFQISELGGTGFPKDSVTSGIPPAKCDECGDEQVTVVCRSCQVFLCDAHISTHLRTESGKNKQHVLRFVAEQLGEMSDEMASASSRRATFPLCSDHGDKMSYHCKDCDIPICGGCAIVGKHRGHNAVHAKDIIEQRKEDVGKTLDKLRRQIEPRLVKSIEDVDGVTGQLTARADQVRDEIRSAIDKAVQTVQAAGEQLLLQVTDIEEERCKYLNEQRDTLKSQLDCVRNAISFGDCLFEQELHAESLPQLVTLAKRAVNLCQEEVTLEPVRHAKLEFLCSEDSTLTEKAFQMTGQVVPYCGSPKHSTIIGNTSVRLFLHDNSNPATFILQVKDRQGEPVETKDDRITTRWLKVPEGQTSEVPLTITSENQPGQYLLRTRPTQLGKYELEVAINGEALASHLMVEVANLMQFDTNQCHQDIKLSSDRLTATHTKKANGYYRTVLGSVGMRKGTFTWKLRIGSNQAWHTLGIAAKPLPNLEYTLDESYSWTSNCVRHGASHDSKPLAQWRTNDSFEFILDGDKHSLQMTNTRSGESHEITGLPDKEFFVYVNMVYPYHTTEFVP